MDIVIASVKRVALLLFTLSLSADPGRAQCQLAELRASDAAVGDFFGNAVSVRGDRALVGAYQFITGGPGHAYVFERQGSDWIQTAKLSAHDGIIFDYVGYSVALGDDRALIGAPHNYDAGGTSSGAAYVFERSGSGWAETGYLIAADGGGSMGWSVALDGDRALLGALGASTTSPATGAAYVFELQSSGWIEVAKLGPGPTAGPDQFGRSVALSGSTAVVGAPRGSGAGTDSGSAYVFERRGAGWSRAIELVAGDKAAGDYFGHAVSIDGGTALVGARFDDHGGHYDAGSVYVYEKRGPVWVETAKVVADDATSYDEFGSSVSICGDHALIGAPGVAAVYVFRRARSGWAQEAKLRAADQSLTGDLYGYAVSCSGSTGIVGASFDSDLGTLFGSAYLWGLDASECSLGSPRFAISLSAGGRQELLLQAGPSRAGKTYLVLGTTAGTTPATNIGNLQLPLAYDGPTGYMLFSLAHPNGPPLAHSLGTLDMSGAAKVAFSLPAGSIPGLAGTLLHHAYLVLDPVTGAPEAVSNPIHLHIKP